MNFSLNKNERRVGVVVIIGLLIALNLVFTRVFYFQAFQNTVRVGLGNLTILIAGMVFGPLAGAVTGGLADFIGATFISPFGWYPPLTTAPILVGLISGIMWRYVVNRPSKSSEANFKADYVNVIKIFLVILITNIIANITVGTYWISVLINTNFWAIVVPRAIVSLSITFFETFVIYFIYKSKLIYIMRGTRTRI